MGSLFNVDGTTGNVNTAGTITAAGAITSSAGDITLQNQHSVIFNDTEGTPKSITLHAPTTLTSSYTLNWPLLQGSSGTALTNDGSGNLSWANPSASAGGSNTQVQYNSSGALAGASGLTTDGTNLTILGVIYNADVNTDVSIDPNGNQLWDSAGPPNFKSLDWNVRQLFDNNSSTVSLDWNARQLLGPTAGIILDWSTTNELLVAGALILENQNYLEFDDTGSNSVSIAAPASVSASYNLYWPTAQGTANSCLQNDGSGNLSWVTISGSAAGSTGDIQFNSSGAFAGNNNLYWDDVNKRLSIGFGTSPLFNLHVEGNARLQDASSKISLESGIVTVSAPSSFEPGIQIQNSDDSHSWNLSIAAANDYLLFGANGFGAGPSAQVVLTPTGQISVGNRTTAPDASAILDLQSTSFGFLAPRMTTTQKNAISSPATGLQVYDTTLNSISFYNGSGWVSGSGSGVTSITGTANQVIASASTGAVTLSLPQSIDTTSTPSFNGVSLTGDSSISVNTTNSSEILLNLTNAGTGGQSAIQFTDAINTFYLGVNPGETGAFVLNSSSNIGDGNGLIISGASGLWTLQAAHEIIFNTGTSVVVSAGNLSVSSGSVSATNANFSNSTNQLLLGTTNTTTISATAPAASRTYTIKDLGTNGNFVLSNPAVSLTGQTSSIGTTTLFTPSATGTYRVSIYIVDTAGTTFTLQGTIGWTDDAEPQTATTSTITNLTDGYTQSSFFIEAVSGNAVSYSVALTGIATYNVYVVAEKLS